jgi:molybdopterin-guanine dinucleotide biosynthesis protein A
MRRYTVAPADLESFNAFFAEWLLPIQERHGARLVGRWAAEDRTTVLAIWQYESRAAYEEIQENVRNDPASRAARAERERLGPLFTDVEEGFYTSTL